MAKAAVIQHLNGGARGAWQERIAKPEPNYIESAEKGSDYTPLAETSAEQQLATRHLN